MRTKGISTRPQGPMVSHDLPSQYTKEDMYTLNPREGALLDVTNLCVQKPQHRPSVSAACQLVSSYWPLPGVPNTRSPFCCSTVLLLLPLPTRSAIRVVSHPFPQGSDSLLPRKALCKEMLSVLPTPATPPALVGLYPSRSTDQGPGITPR